MWDSVRTGMMIKRKAFSQNLFMKHCQSIIPPTSSKATPIHSQFLPECSVCRVMVCEQTHRHSSWCVNNMNFSALFCIQYQTSLYLSISKWSSEAQIQNPDFEFIAWHPWLLHWEPASQVTKISKFSLPDLRGLFNGLSMWHIIMWEQQQIVGQIHLQLFSSMTWSVCVWTSLETWSGLKPHKVCLGLTWLTFTQKTLTGCKSLWQLCRCMQ